MSIVREAYKRKWMWVLTGTWQAPGSSGALTYRQHRAPATQSLAPDGAYCESGIGAAKGHAATAPAEPSLQSNRQVKLPGFRKSTTPSRLNRLPME